MLPTLLVLASTYPRWQGDPEPGFVHELAKRLTDRFHVIAVVPSAPGALARETLDGVEVIRYRYAPRRWETLVNDGGIVTNLKRQRWKLLLVPTFLLGQAWQAWHVLRARRVDVVHAHWLIPQGLIAALLRRFTHRASRFLVTSHGADMFALRGGGWDRAKRWVVSQAAAVTVVSATMCDELRHIGANVDKLVVQSMGVDLIERFTPDATQVRSAGDILFVGRLVEKKGLKYLLDAMPAVLVAFPDARLTIAGFGPLEPELREQAKRLKLEANVQFVGAVPQDQLPVLYRQAALFVAPFVQAPSGDQEGLGLVCVEAAGCGCPLVVSDLPATRDLFVESAGCIRVPPGESGILAQAVIEILGNPEAALVAAADQRQQAIRHFDWLATSRNYARLLQKCMDAEDRYPKFEDQP
jgi:glycosyltransferase involved in cell wall biosynthesis